MTTHARKRFPLNWGLLAAIATLTAVFGASTYSLYRLNESVHQSAGPQEGYYWAVAQYQFAFLEMRELLQLEAAGQPVEPEKHQLRVDLLDSKGRILTEPSELTQVFARLGGYPEIASELTQFQGKVIPALRAKPFARESASALIPEFEAAESILLRLANEVRVEQIRRSEATFAGQLQRGMLLWIVIAASWALLVAWLVTLARSEMRFRRAAEEEAAARRSEQAAIEEKQEAVRAKSNFLGMVSHELRSPLQDILSSLEILERRATGEEAEFVSRVRRSANALKAQLRDLLTLATGEAGRLEIRPETFEAGELLASIVDMFYDEATRKHLRLLGNIPDEPVFAIADAKRIMQVLTNLVSNAVKYTDVGGVEVSLEPFDAERSELVFVVADTGRGIPSEYLPTLFSAYTRFGALEHGGREGAGIGLAIVHTVLQHLGGRVDVESKVGEGTKFTVRIPATMPDCDAPAGEATEVNHVLVVDDRPEVLDALASMASELGYTCDKAASAAVAANLLAAKKFDVVFIDLNMAVKGGLELASETRRSDGPNRETRLVAISAAEGRGVGSSWPFNAFLEKPIDRWALSEAIAPRMPG